jgi:hypothetical protein
MEMSYRLSAIGYLLSLSLISACGGGGPARSDGPYDLILKNGWIVDGSGNPRYRGDVAIRGDRIAAVGFLGNATAKDTVDARGLVVAPGFIDMMGQSEINVLIDNRVLSKVTQGITTEVTGEGGSVAPLTDRLVADDSDAMKKWHYREDWRDLNGYFGARPDDGDRRYPHGAGRAGRLDGARVRAGELLQDRRAHRARPRGAAARRDLRLTHAR